MRKEVREDQAQLASVSNALRILSMLKTETSLRVTGVGACELGVSDSTAHRLLNTMRQLGFVEQEVRGRSYRAGWELVEMGLQSSGRLEIRDQARSVLEELRDELNETSNLLVMEGRFVRFVDGVESRSPVRVAIRTGQRVEAHGTAAGKVLLAERPTSLIRSLFAAGRLAASTPKTITTLNSLLQELDVVRRQGFAANLGEAVPDLNAVGVKVLDSAGHAVAALTLSAPASRLHKVDVPRIASRLLLASAKLTRLTWDGESVVSA